MVQHDVIMTVFNQCLLLSLMSCVPFSNTYLLFNMLLSVSFYNDCVREFISPSDNIDQGINFKFRLWGVSFL